jgi:hypothetical protein
MGAPSRRPRLFHALRGERLCRQRHGTPLRHAVDLRVSRHQSTADQAEDKQRDENFNEGKTGIRSFPVFWVLRGS